MGRITPFLCLVLCLFLFSAPFVTATREISGTIVSFTTGTDISAIHYEIDDSKKWIRLKAATFAAPGRVAFTAIIPPDKNENFFIEYTFLNSNNNAQLGIAKLNLDDMQVISNSASVEFGKNFALCTYATSGNSQKFREGFFSKDNLVSSKVGTTGKPGKAKSKVFADDPDFFPVSTSFSWDGHVVSQSNFSQAIQGFRLDFQNLNGIGKATGKPKEFLVSGRPFCISATRNFDKRYFLASSDV